MKNKRTRELVKALQDAGYRVEASKHITAYNDENNKMVVMSKTPSDARAVDNACGDLKRHGFKFEFAGKKYNCG